MHSPEAIAELLESTVRHGARAAELLANSRPLVEAIYTGDPAVDATPAERAIDAEREIHAALDELDERVARYLKALLSLTPGTYRRCATDRYRIAGEAFGVSQRTAYFPHYRDRFLMELAMSLYRRRLERL